MSNPLPYFTPAQPGPKPSATRQNGPGSHAESKPLVALVSVMLIMVAFACDSLINDLVVMHPSQAGTSAADWISKYGNLPFLLLYAAMLAGGSFAFNRPAWRQLALALAVASCLSGCICTTIRATTGRTRPCAQVAQGWYGPRRGAQWIICKHAYNSFPSGHVGTAAGFGGILLIGAKSLRAKAAGLLLIILMAWARVFLRCHHLSDAIVASLVRIVTAHYVWHSLMSKK